MKQVFVKSNVVVEVVSLPLCGDNEMLLANAFSVINVGTELPAVMRGERSLVMTVLARAILSFIFFFLTGIAAKRQLNN